MIVIVGIGEKIDEVTMLGKKALDSAAYVVARTASQAFGIKYAETLDDIYVNAENYHEFNLLAAERLFALEKRHGSIIYAVAGDGYSDSSTALLYETALKNGVEIEIIAGASDIKVPYSSLQILNAYDLSLKVELDSQPLMVHSIDSALIASEVKLFLLKFFDFDTKVEFYNGEGLLKITIEDIDRQSKYNAFCRIFVFPNSGFDKKIYTYGDLIRILEHLTGENGCPWDKEQTHESIRTNMIEEAYEAVTAIDNGDIDNLIEELGDVMLQSVFNADIAKRHGEFEMSDVLSTLCRKLYTRHTHIFGENKASDATDALRFWDEAKAIEKQGDSLLKDATKGTEKDLLTVKATKIAYKNEDLSANSIKNELLNKYNGLPSLLRAQKIIRKLEKSGELSPKVNINQEKLFNISAECNGKLDLAALIFSAVRLCEENGIDAETELNKYITTFLKK